MLEHLILPSNKITVDQPVLDLDRDEKDVFHIGDGYGIFRGLTQEEYSVFKDNRYTSVGIIIHFVPDTTLDTAVVDSKTVAKDSTHTEPRVGDYCTWRGVRYDLSSVRKCPDIFGDMVGYKVFCSNGQ